MIGLLLISAMISANGACEDQVSTQLLMEGAWFPATTEAAGVVEGRDVRLALFVYPRRRQWDEAQLSCRLSDLSSVPSDTTALAAALTRVRGVIPRGEVLVSQEVGIDAWGVEDRPSLLRDSSLIANAAANAGLVFGPDSLAMRCPPTGGCRGVSGFRGVVHVWDFERTSETQAIVRIRILKLGPEVGWIYEEVDDILVERDPTSGDWSISAVTKVSVS